MKYLILLSGLLFATPAIAEDAPSCTKKTLGQVTCMANKLCECGFERASAMKGTPDMFKWDCGITRPNCMDYNKIEEVVPYNGPTSVEIEKNGVTTTINN